MNLKTTNILLIEDDPDYAELVEQWLSADSGEEQYRLRWADTLAQGRAALDAGPVDVILLDLGLPDSEGWPTFEALRDRVQGIPVIVLSGADSEALALRTIQAGAEDYLVKNNCNRDLLIRCLRHSIARHRSQSGKRDGSGAKLNRIVGVLGVKGGVGGTTVACNLADALALETGENVLLADLDQQSGYVAFLTGVEPKFTLQDAVNHIDGLDSSHWQRIVTEKRRNLHVLASPCLWGKADLDPAAVRRLLSAVSPYYSWTVLDLGRLNPFSLAVLETADDLLIVATTAITSLYGAKWVIDALGQAGFDRERFHLVVNRAGESQSLSTAEMNRMFGVPVRAVLPAAAAELHLACVERKLPPENSKLRREFTRLARSMAGIAEPENHGLAQLFSFTGGRKKEDKRKPVPAR